MCKDYFNTIIIGKKLANSFNCMVPFSIIFIHDIKRLILSNSFNIIENEYYPTKNAQNIQYRPLFPLYYFNNIVIFVIL